jgi:hypothetical protein
LNRFKYLPLQLVERHPRNKGSFHRQHVAVCNRLRAHPIDYLITPRRPRSQCFISQPVPARVRNKPGQLLGRLS